MDLARNQFTANVYSVYSTLPFFHCCENLINVVLCHSTWYFTALSYPRQRHAMLTCVCHARPCYALGC